MVSILLLLTFASLASAQEDRNTSFYQPVYSDCGGVIPINPIYPTVLKYKTTELYKSNEFCVWTFLSHGNLSKIQLKGIQNYTGGFDGLVVYSWDGAGLNSTKLPFGELDVTFSASLSFLTFATNTVAELYGFDIEIVASGTPGVANGRAFHVKEDEGTFTYPEPSNDQLRYGSNERVSVVVQPQTPSAEITKDISIRDIDIDPLGDSLSVYTLLPRFAAQQEIFIGRYSGRHEGKVDNSTTDFVYPNVYLFSSDNKVEGSGFTIAWKNFTYKI